MKKFKNIISLKIILVDILLVAGMSYLVPILSGYPPFSEESSFQLQIEGLTHIQQYILFGIFGTILHLVFINVFFKNIFIFLKGYEKKETFTLDFIKKVREQCFSMNKKLFFLQLFILIVLLSVLFTNVRISIVLCIKFLLIYFSFMMTSAIIYILLIRDHLNDVIRKTYTQYEEVELKSKKTKFNINLIMNLLPFFFIVLIISCLLGYSKVCDKQGESSYYYYYLYLNNQNYSELSFSDLKNKLDTIPLKNNEDYYIIIPNNNESPTYFSSPKGNISDFFLLYMDNYSSKTDGRVYEYFGVDEQAYMNHITLIDGKTYTIGFKYSNTSVDTILFFITIVIFSTIAFLIIITFWAKNASKNIIEVSSNLINISNSINIETQNILPILSTDEIGDLTRAFNKIRKLTNIHISQIKNNQETLMEKERLASLGQLIGGIAHNLKTPIMSISGAAEGLTDLIKEYDSSIEDPEVNIEDHHEIAKDMISWINKLKTHTEYMSDIITAVKGQAVTLSNEENFSFTVGELFKKVNILMRHELKNALVYLNVQMKVDENILISGDVNSLVQVVNNMISNSIQAYNGKPEQTIFLIVEKENNNLVISIKDEGVGISKKIQDKLFKEMVTTKGKNGTGLGLYMSYSTIKANFKGDIVLESEENKSTTFKIILPIHN